jgi:competence protein ComGC
LKNQKGITLVSLTIYIIIVFVLMVTLVVVRNNYNSSLNEVNKEANVEAEYNKFNLYFLEDIKKQGNSYELTKPKGDTELYEDIKFSSTGNEYKFDSATSSVILKNTTTNVETTLLENVQNCTFSKSTKEGKKIVKVDITIKDTKIEKDYVLPEENDYNGYQDEQDYIHIVNNTVTNTNTTNDTNTNTETNTNTNSNNNA